MNCPSCNQALEALEALGRKIAGILFNDSRCGLGWQHVIQHDCVQILSERLCVAGELLGQHPHANTNVAS